MSLEPTAPPVSIGLPVRNGEATLREALRSLRAQTYPHFELIVSDNASTDGTADICREQAAADPRIRIVRQPRNIGILENFRFVLREARGRYFMWAAADDTWDATFLATMFAELRANPRRSLAFCLYENVDSRGRRVRLYDNLTRLARPAGRLGRLLRMLWFPEADGKASLIYGLMPVDVLRRIGGAATYTNSLEGFDYLIVFRLATEGPIAVVPRVLFHKRHPQDPEPPSPSRLTRWAVAISPPPPVPRSYLLAYLHQLPHLPLSPRESGILLLNVCMRLVANEVQGAAHTSHWWLMAFGRRVVLGRGSTRR